MKLLLALSILLSGSMTLACLPMPGFESRIENELLLSVANEYYVNLKDNSITVSEQKYDISWTYTDSGFQCHDTDMASAKFDFKTNRFGQVCFFTVEGKIISKPEAANQEAKTTITKNLTSKDCLSKPLD